MAKAKRFVDPRSLSSDGLASVRISVSLNLLRQSFNATEKSENVFENRNVVLPRTSRLKSSKARTKQKH